MSKSNNLIVNLQPKLDKMKVKKLWFYIGFFVIVAILFTVALYWGTDNWKTKPAVMNNVKPFTFETQDGRSFTRQNMIGKVCVVEYFFTHCTGICPHLNTNMKEVYNDFKDQPDFLIMSHTCDPERDSASQLKHYSDSLKIDNNKWVFLTGRKDSLYKAARESYLLDDPKNALQNINDQFIHTQFWAVVDKNGMVRGQIYDGLKKDEIAQMENLVQELLKEKVGPTNTNFILN